MPYKPKISKNIYWVVKLNESCIISIYLSRHVFHSSLLQIVSLYSTEQLLNDINTESKIKWAGICQRLYGVLAWAKIGFGFKRFQAFWFQVWNMKIIRQAILIPFPGNQTHRKCVMFYKFIFWFVITISKKFVVKFCIRFPVDPG